MLLVALVTLILLIQLIVFSLLVGAARVKHKIQAPAMEGHPEFEARNRIHQNTIEQLMLLLPSMWVCGLYFNSLAAASLGFTFFIGRILYALGYSSENKDKRAPGMIIGFLSVIALLVCGLWGVVSKLI